ncbi:hypothetical protein GCM10023093_06390 [Nemorincola caseinilytica]|uniref:Uncharacterized protein n=1 Tax=Nemorincola caseinilytica TaxID=2054315 RepID=A0ABP8N809_9BACT
MSLTTLKDDLLAEFREERIMINDQLEVLDPLATALRRPAAQRLLSSSTLIIAEFTCYVLSLGGIAFAVLMHRIYPFSLLNKALYTPDVRNAIGAPHLSVLIAATYALVAIGVVFLFVIARMARELRLKNDILHMACRDIKTIVGQHLERRAAVRTIEQRHMLGLSGVMPVTDATKVNPVKEMANAGY